MPRTGSREQLIAKGFLPCRCCGKPVPIWLGRAQDGKIICTKCIPKHWGKHQHGVNASRCLEFGQKARIIKRRAEIDSRKRRSR